MATTINNYIYFYHLEKFCVLPVFPETLTDSLQSTFDSTSALARSAPVFTYSHSGPRSMTVDLRLHRDLLFEANDGVSNFGTTDYNITDFLKANPEVDPKKVVPFNRPDYVDILIKYLEAMALPKYSIASEGYKSVIPPMIAIRFGNEIFIKGVVNGGVNVQYNKPLITMEDGSVKYGSVTMSFTVSEVMPFDADSVVEMGSFRGIAHAFKDGIYTEYNHPNNDSKKEPATDPLDIYGMLNLTEPTLIDSAINRGSELYRKKKSYEPGLVDPAINRSSKSYKS